MNRKFGKVQNGRIYDFFMKLKLALLFILCASFSFAAHAQFKGTGKLAGKLLKANGRPLPYTEVELVPVLFDVQIPDQRFWATSDSRGNFSFKDLPPTQYTLSINFNESPSDLSPYQTYFYPHTASREDAEVFDIENASNLKNLSFRLPSALAQKTVKGRVVDENGKPIAGIHVGLLNAESKEITFGFEAVTDKNGNFILKGFEHIKYVVTAVEIELPKTPFTMPPPPTGYGKSETFTLDAQTPQIFVILEKIENEVQLDKNVG